MDPDVKLTMETMAECLSLLCKTGDGLAHAYVRFDAPDRYAKRHLTCLLARIKNTYLNDTFTLHSNINSANILRFLTVF